MFRYFQRSEEGGWTPVTDSHDVEDRVKAENGRKMTILAVSHAVNEETDREALSYKGPLYFDIDYKGDITEAIRSAKDLCRTLVERYEVPKEAIWPFCSGSKGVHILIPETVFSSGRAMKQLPLVYKEMARQLSVVGLDFQVYSTGRGNSFRLANLQRADGNYRVPITYEELFALTGETYLQYVSGPREVVRHDVRQLKAPALEAMFEASKKVAKERPRLIDVLPVEALEPIKHEAPRCLEALAEGKAKADVNFNQIGMQAAAWAARAGVKEDVYRPLLVRIGDNTHSSQYATARERHNHLTSLVSYVKHTPKFGFSCAAMRSVISFRPCEGCKLDKKGQDGDVKERLKADLGIDQDEEGYYRRVGDDGKQRLTNFLLTPQKVLMELPQDGRAAIRTATLMEVIHNGEVATTVTMDENAFDSKNGFLQAIRGVQACAYFGGDLEIQKIKAWLFSQMENASEVRRVYSAGIQIERIEGQALRTYVEPGYSVNQYRVEGTHLLSGTIFAPPKLREVPGLVPGDVEVKEALHHLVRLNQPHIMGLVVGWFCAAHLRQHFNLEFNQFPLLNLWGGAGAGKSTLVALMTHLNGCDFTGDDGLLNVALVRKEFTIDDFVSSTTTIPRVLDEFNKSKMSADRYTYVSEVLKAAWNSQSTGRGSLSRGNINGRGRSGAEITRYPISAPLVTLSEQPPEMPAVVQRCITVNLTASGRRAVNGQKHLNEVQQDSRRQGLRRVGKLMTSMALATDTGQVRTWLEVCLSKIDPGFNERPRFAYATALVGLIFFARAMAQAKIDVQDDIAMLTEQMLEHLAQDREEIGESKRRTEVDSLLTTVMEMIELTNTGLDNLIVAGQQYRVTEEGGKKYFYFDLMTVHALYMRYERRNRERPALGSPTVLLKLLRDEPYFVADKAMPPPTGLEAPTRGMVMLDVHLMQSKGIPVEGLL